MESGTIWTPSQLYGIANIDKQPCDRQMPCKGRNLSTAPGRICCPWYPQGPDGRKTLLVIAKPLFLFTYTFLNRRDFDLQWKIASSLYYLFLQLGSYDGWRIPHRGSSSGELTGGGKRHSHLRVRGNGAASMTLVSSSSQLPITQHMGRNSLNAETVKSHKGFRCCPACSSINVCLRGAMHQRIGRGNIPCVVSPHLQGARLALQLVHQGDGILYPVGRPVLGDSLPFLLTSTADKELLGDSEALGAVHIFAQCFYRTQQCQGWTCLLRGSACRFTTWLQKGVVGTLGTYPGQGLTPLKSNLEDREIPGGFKLLAPLKNLTMRSCFP